MPVLNEAGYLRDSVQSILEQDYPGDHELVLALGPSTDGTTQLATELARADNRIRLVENPGRDIPIGLNRAIEASRYPIIVRVDAHSELSPSYTRDAVRVLRETGAANVGGVMLAVGETPVQRAIAHAYNSPIGLGGGTYHVEGAEGPAESAYLGVFTRAAYDAVGGFNPRIRRGEDWEFNLRLRRAGYSVWFTPALRVQYRPRSTFAALGKQFFATGSWRAALVRMYGRENPWRFFVPGSYVLMLLVAVATMALWGLDVFPRGTSWPLVTLVPPVSHVVVCLVGGIQASRGGIRDAALTSIALLTMHLSWGGGFLFGLIAGSERVIDRSRMVR